ncbi:MAG: hypothetical protein MJ100_06230 [Ruminococcus sp.]|nr:hypothetical protein [Ruminococcus sp.]
MNRILRYTAVCLCLAAAFAGCEKKNKPTENSSEIVTTAAVTTSSATASTTAETSAEKVTTVTTAEKPTSAQPDPLGNNAFSCDDAGAVIFSETPEKQDDATLIAAAQKLFESACRTQWDFCNECPYELDYDCCIENEFGWLYYKVDDENIRTASDLLKDYHKVFSDRYPAPEPADYIEQSDGLYIMPSGRGQHLYYSVSKITGIASRSGDEIFFNVENYYDRTDTSDEPYSESAVFSAVIDGEKLLAGQFTLPF